MTLSPAAPIAASGSTDATADPFPEDGSRLVFVIGPFGAARRDLLVKIRLPVDGRVTNADAQDVSTSSGTLSIKDRRTGEPRVWGGKVRDATFRLQRVESGRRGVRTDGRLKIRKLSGRGDLDGAALRLRVRGLKRGRG